MKKNTHKINNIQKINHICQGKNDKSKHYNNTPTNFDYRITNFKKKADIINSLTR